MHPAVCRERVTFPKLHHPNLMEVLAITNYFDGVRVWAMGHLHSRRCHRLIEYVAAVLFGNTCPTDVAYTIRISNASLQGSTNKRFTLKLSCLAFLATTDAPATIPCSLAMFSNATHGSITKVGAEIGAQMPDRFQTIEGFGRRAYPHST